MQLLVVLATFIGLASVAFALQNNVPVTVTFLFWRFDSSLAMVLLLAFALGALVVGLVSTPSTLRRQWTISRQGKRIHELEKTQENLMVEVGKLRSKLPAEQAQPPETHP